MSSQHRGSTVKSLSFRLLLCSITLAALVGEATASNRQKYEARPQNLSRGVATTAQSSVSHSRHSHDKHQIFTRDGAHCHRKLCVGV
jgi:hypothetical protein